MSEAKSLMGEGVKNSWMPVEEWSRSWQEEQQQIREPGRWRSWALSCDGLGHPQPCP